MAEGSEHFEATVEDEVAAQAAAIEQRLGHVESETATHEGKLVQGTAAETTPQPALAFPRVTRDALRHAIVMREILGPPLAMRPRECEFGVLFNPA